MNWNALFVGILLLITSTVMIANSAIGIECYNKNQELKTNRPSNFQFLIVTIVFAILVILSAFSALGMGLKQNPLPMTSYNRF